MTMYIINVVVDCGILRDDKTKKEKKWEGVRLVVREVTDNEARTYIAKATSDFPTDEVLDEISDNGSIVVNRLLYDRFGRVVGYDVG